MAPDKSAEQENRAQQQEFVAVGRVIRPHGVYGNLLVEPISELFLSIDTGSQVFIGGDRNSAEVKFVKPHRDRYIVAVESCESREQAEAWRDQEICLRTDDSPQLPTGTYYQWQIVGLSVETEEGEYLGKIERILVTGANDVYLIGIPGGNDLLLPAIEDVIREIDLENERMIVHLLPGLRQDEPDVG